MYICIRVQCYVLRGERERERENIHAHECYLCFICITVFLHNNIHIPIYKFTVHYMCSSTIVDTVRVVCVHWNGNTFIFIFLQLSW